jgi:TRAP-type C4-dicarboxylate transport system permease small subunit
MDASTPKGGQTMQDPPPQSSAAGTTQAAALRYKGITGHLAAGLLCLLMAIILLQILGRFGIFPGQVWTEELTRWLWVWMALLGVAAAEKRQEHLRMEFLTQLLPARLRRWCFRVQDGVALVLAAYLCWQGVKGVLRTLDNESVTLPVPDAVLYLSLPVGMALWFLVLARRLR